MKRSQPATYQDKEILPRVATGEPVVVPQDVFQGINAVRLSGRTNMLDRSTVADLAAIMGFSKATEWIMKNSRAYSRGVFSGFLVEEHEPQEE